MPRPDGTRWTTDEDIEDEGRRDDRNADIAVGAPGVAAEGCFYGCLTVPVLAGFLFVPVYVLLT